MMVSKHVYRTPEDRFHNLPGYDFTPNYIEIEDEGIGPLRQHYVDEGAKDGPVVLLLHGEPSWSYLYRKMIRPLAKGGCRVIAPDLIGFGKSDKPTQKKIFTYARHVAWMRAFIESLDLKDITLFCQDWGGLIGLRCVADVPECFARVAVGNTGLPTGENKVPKAFKAWRTYSQWSPTFPIGKIISKAVVRGMSEDIIAAYNAPFSSRKAKAAARMFPILVPITPDDPGAIANREAWKVLENFEKPFLTCFSNRDPITRGGDKVFQARIPGCKNQPHTTIKNAGHFLQEDAGEELAELMLQFMGRG